MLAIQLSPAVAAINAGTEAAEQILRARARTAYVMIAQRAYALYISYLPLIMLCYALLVLCT
jgi:hypothetical protein